jgi:hypothetical protein
MKSPKAEKKSSPANKPEKLELELSCRKHMEVIQEIFREAPQGNREMLSDAMDNNRSIAKIISSL